MDHVSSVYMKLYHIFEVNIHLHGGRKISVFIPSYMAEIFKCETYS